MKYVKELWPCNKAYNSIFSMMELFTIFVYILHNIKHMKGMVIDIWLNYMEDC